MTHPTSQLCWIMLRGSKTKRRLSDGVSYMASFWRETLHNGPNKDLKLKGELMFWRTVLEGRVEFKGSICLKLLHISPYVF
jgi:hypothetical protein